jgi:hypothetical protein
VIVGIRQADTVILSPEHFCTEKTEENWRGLWMRKGLNVAREVRRGHNVSGAGELQYPGSVKQGL